MLYHTETNELTHHGIRGMRWGIRRYQNKDGSLTPAGRKRAAKMKEEYTALTGKRLIRKPTPKNQNGEKDVKKKKIKDMTDEELNNEIKRLDNEKRLASLRDDTASTSSKIKTSMVRDVIAPAAKEAGKELLKSTLLKIGKEKLGLDNSKSEAADEVYKELKKEVSILELKRNKYKFQEEIKKHENKHAKEAAEKKNSQPEKVKTEFIENKNKKSNTTSDTKEKVIIDDAFEEVGKSTVEEYRNYRLPIVRR